MDTEEDADLGEPRGTDEAGDVSPSVFSRRRRNVSCTWAFFSLASTSPSLSLSLFASLLLFHPCLPSHPGSQHLQLPCIIHQADVHRRLSMAQQQVVGFPSRHAGGAFKEQKSRVVF